MLKRLVYLYLHMFIRIGKYAFTVSVATNVVTALRTKLTCVPSPRPWGVEAVVVVVVGERLCCLH